MEIERYFFKNTSESRYVLRRGEVREVFEPGELRELPEGLAKHYIWHINGPLVRKENVVVKETGTEVVEEEDEETTEERRDLEDLTWPQLQKMGSEAGVYKGGMNKQDLIEALS